jgi:hypothetical protein
MLGAADFQAEQDYFREKLKLHNRCLHGYGVVCGLEVVPEPVAEGGAPPGPSARPQLDRELLELQRSREEASRHGSATYTIDRDIAEVQRRIDCLPEEAGAHPPRAYVRIDCGLAYDCEGNELVLRRQLPVDLLAAMEPPDARRVREAAAESPDATPAGVNPPVTPQAGVSPAAKTPVTQPTTTQPASQARPVPLYLSLCYCEQSVGPVRPVLAEACGAMPDCTFGKLRDAIQVRVSLAPPEQDERCDACCESCHDGCVLLARIDDFVLGRPVRADQIHNEIRRSLAPYALTRVAGVSWSHGATYSDDEAGELLDRANTGGGGLELRFSRPVRTSTITPGVVDVWVVEGGSGRHAYMYNMDVEVNVGTGQTTDRMHIRQTSGERLDEGDRVLIQLRASFVLDVCCYALDGENIGGRVPILAEYAERFRRGTPPTECLTPRYGSIPWMSGNGSQAGTFESWFYIGAGKGGKRGPGPKGG